MLQGIIFDMDGVIFDTERIYIELEHSSMAEMGFSVTKQQQALLAGINSVLYKERLCNMLGENFNYEQFRHILNAKENNYFAQNIPPVKDGVPEALAQLEGSGYNLALASSNNREIIFKLLSQAGLMKYFGAIVSGDMVQNSKPHPEIFEKAAALLNLSPAACAAVEDSKSGLQSAAAAGCATIMVPDVYPADDECKKLCTAILPSAAKLPAFLEFYQNDNYLPLTFKDINLL